MRILHIDYIRGSFFNNVLSLPTTFQQARPASTSHFDQWPPFGYDAWTCPPKLDAEKAMTLAVCRGDMWGYNRGDMTVVKLQK